MKKWLILPLLGLMLTACSSNETNNEPSNNSPATGWDYTTGYVIAKESSKILIVPNQDMTDLDGKTADEFIQATNPEAAWITAANEADLTDIEVGDEVKLELVGDVSEAYPAEGEASSITEIASN